MLNKFYSFNFKILVSLFLIFSLFQPVLSTDASASSLDFKYIGTVSYSDQYGTNVVGHFTINGQDAFCILHSAPTPATGQDYTSYSAYKNIEMQRALYYGWNGPKNIFSSFNQGYVVTSLVLSRLNGHDGGGHTLPGYQTLYDLATSNKTYVPVGDFNFSTKTPAVHYNSKEQYTDTITMNGDPNNKIWISLPSGVHLWNETTGKATGWVSGGNKFHLYASLNYSGKVNTGQIQSSIAPFQPYVMAFRGNYQPVIVVPHADPPVEAGFSATFVPRTVNITAQYIDTYNNSTMWTENKGTVNIGSGYSVTASTNGFTGNGSRGANGATYKETGSSTVSGTAGSTNIIVKFYYDRYWNNKVVYQNKFPNYQIFNQATKQVKVNSGFSWTIPSSLTSGSDTYDLYNNGSIQSSNYTYSGKQPDNDISKTFLYILRRGITVNYYDNRTGSRIDTSPAPNPKGYNLHQGDNWSENPVTAHEDGYTARLAGQNASEGKWSGNNVSGTVGTSNITVNYYYDIPLMKIGVKDLQVFTAPEENGLPVKVALDKVYNYNTNIGDMGSKTINVSLYQGNTRLDTQKYAAKNVPSNLTFTVPSSFTSNKGNGTSLPYTVKFEGYSANDFDVIANEANLTTDGYTSAKANLLFDVNSNSTHSSSNAYVVRTETSADGTYKDTKTNETFAYSATPLAKNKSGYGDSTNVNVDYDNALGSNYQYGYKYNKTNKLTFSISNKFKVAEDTANLWSEAPSVYGTSGNNVTVLMDNASQSGYAKSGDYTQSDSYQFPQVYSEHETGALHASNPSGQYVDGGHEFYAPIWVDLAKYPVNYQSTAMGVNEVSVDLQDSWNIYAQMFLTMDSETNKANPGVTNAADKYDEILFEPVDTTNPFPNGVPAGWSNADVQALKSEKPFN